MAQVGGKELQRIPDQQLSVPARKGCPLFLLTRHWPEQEGRRLEWKAHVGLKCIEFTKEGALERWSRAGEEGHGGLGACS